MCNDAIFGPFSRANFLCCFVLDFFFSQGERRDPTHSPPLGGSRPRSLNALAAQKSEEGAKLKFGSYKASLKGFHQIHGFEWTWSSVAYGGFLAGCLTCSIVVCGTYSVNSI